MQSWACSPYDTETKTEIDVSSSRGSAKHLGHQPTSLRYSTVQNSRVVFYSAVFFAPYIEKQRCKYTYMLSHIYLYIYKHIYKDMRIHTCINTVTHGAIPPNPENVDFLFLDNVWNFLSMVCSGYARITLLIKRQLVPSASQQKSQHIQNSSSQPKDSGYYFLHWAPMFTSESHTPSSVAKTLNPQPVHVEKCKNPCGRHMQKSMWKSHSVIRLQYPFITNALQNTR